MTEEGIVEPCTDSVNYSADMFGTNDFLDTDCDGRVDEELCIGHHIQIGSS